MKRTIIFCLSVLLTTSLLIGLALAGQSNPWATTAKPRPYIPSSVIYPDQVIPLRFFHDKHIAQEIDCATCHEAAEESVSSADQLVPVGEEGEEMCSLCHDFSEGEKADPPSACWHCHTKNYEPKLLPDAEPGEFRKVENKPEPMVLPRAHLKMNHKVHVDRGIPCAECHGDMKEIQVATRDNSLPLMNTCMGCHNDQNGASSECRTCHLTHPDGRMRTEFDTGSLMPAGNFRNDAHVDGYIKTHAATAQNEEAYCANCHTQKYCLDCHNGVQKSLRVHPNNWIITHPVSARRNAWNCNSCHRTQNFCMECHKRMKVAPSGALKSNQQSIAFDRQRFGSFHPAGWVGSIANNAARSPNHHGFHAQRNIRQCASCHTENTCLTCHSTATGLSPGANINPHPPRFGRSIKCKQLRASNSRMCAKCHIPVPQCM